MSSLNRRAENCPELPGLSLLFAALGSRVTPDFRLFIIFTRPLFMITRRPSEDVIHRQVSTPEVWSVSVSVYHSLSLKIYRHNQHTTNFHSGSLLCPVAFIWPGRTSPCMLYSFMMLSLPLVQILSSFRQDTLNTYLYIPCGGYICDKAGEFKQWIVSKWELGPSERHDVALFFCFYRQMGWESKLFKKLLYVDLLKQKVRKGDF